MQNSENFWRTIMIEIKPGDYLVSKQENGEQLHILVYPNSILIKAGGIGTKLETAMDSDYLQYVRVVPRKSGV